MGPKGLTHQDAEIKTECIMKLSNFNFQWTKTLYQNNLNDIAFFFAFSRAIVVIGYLSNNTKENFLWEPEKIYVKFHKNC